MLKQYNKVFTGELQPKRFMNEMEFRRVSRMELFLSLDLEASICSIAVESTGNYLLGGEEEGRVVMYDLTRMNKSPTCVGEISLFKAYPNKPYPSPIDVKWFPSEPGWISTLSRGILQFYDANADCDEPFEIVDTKTDSKYGEAFRLHKHHPWNNRLVAGLSGTELRIFDLRVGHFVQTLTLPPNTELFSNFAINRRTPTTLAVSALSSYSTSGDSYIFEYDGRNIRQVVRSYICKASPSPSPLPPSVSPFSSSSSSSAAATQAKQTKTLPSPAVIKARQAVKRRQTEREYAHSRSISYLHYSQDGQYLYSHSIDGVIRKWSTDFGKCEKESHVPSKKLYTVNCPSMDIIETTPAVAVVPRTNEIFLIDIENDKLLQTLKGHVSQIRDVKYDPVYNRVFSVAKEHMLLTWEDKGSAAHDQEALSNQPKKNVITTTNLFDTEADYSD